MGKTVSGHVSEGWRKWAEKKRRKLGTFGEVLERAFTAAERHGLPSEPDRAPTQPDDPSGPGGRSRGGGRDFDGPGGSSGSGSVEGGPSGEVDDEDGQADGDEGSTPWFERDLF